MSKSFAQRFTELTGGCWHIFRQKSEDEWATMKCQKCGFETNELNAQFTETAHPTYSNPKDILEKMKEFLTQKQFDDFITFLGFMGVPYFYYIRIEYITTPNLLLEKAIEFLEAK